MSGVKGQIIYKLRDLRQMLKITNAYCRTIAGAGLLIFSVTCFPQSVVQRAINEQAGAERSAAQTQTRINQLDDQAQAALAEYRAAVSETESLNRYNRVLADQLKSQQEELDSLQAQLNQIDNTNREVYPSMQRMLSTLEQFVKLDVPFLQEERTNRIATIYDIMGRADVSTAEKYRRLMEAYGVEMEYGRTIESYTGAKDGREVDFLRVGRVALLYQTSDQEETGYWDKNSKSWVVNNDYKTAVRDGLRVAKKQAAPALMNLPIPAPEEAK